MRHFLRCTGWLIFGLLLFLASPALRGQTAEDLLAAQDYAAAARAFAARNTRSGHLQAGLAWYRADSLDRARAAYRAATLGPDGKLVTDSITGLALHKTGVICYDLYDDAGAINYYRRAVEVRDAIFPEAHNDRAHSRTNLATCLRFVGKLDSAALVTRQTIDLYGQLAHPDSVNWLRSLVELADIALELEDLQLANSSFVSALKLLLARPAVSAEDAFNCYYLGARISLNFEDGSGAVRYAQRAVELAEAADKPSWLADALNVLANAERLRGNPAATRTAFQQAVALLEAKDPSSSRLSTIYLNLAVIAANDQQYRQALAYCDQAAQTLGAEVGLKHLELAIRRGAILSASGSYPAALTTLNEGFALLGGVPAEPAGLPQLIPDSLSAKVYNEAIRLLDERGSLLAKTGRKKEALADFSTFFNLLDLLRGRVNSDESRRYLSSNFRTTFDRVIDLSLADGQAGTDEEACWRAFELSERAKAYSLLAAQQRSRTTMPLREARLRQRIAELEREVIGKEVLAGQLEAARLELDRILALDRETPELPAFSFDRKALVEWVGKQQTELLAYHLGETKAYLFHLSPGGKLTVKELGETASLVRLSESWNSALASSAYRRKSLLSAGEQYRLDSIFLQQGLQLAERVLPALPATGSLSIIPDGRLSFIPFAALPTGAQTLPLDYGKLTYLQTGRTITYAYAARFLLEVYQLPAIDYRYNLLGFAPSFNGPENQAARRSVAGENLRALPGLRPLRYNQVEVEAIGGMMAQAKLFLGEAANRNSFLQWAGKARIVHLSSHGMVNGQNPNLSFVAFSQDGDSLQLEELLYFNDLSSLPLKTELAVLSACETNLGAYVPGETTLSLASAFAAAGARSTLTTLWQVDDEATKELMVAFYRALTAGADRAGALAAAQASLRERADFAHPFYWSAMTLYGDARPISFAQGNQKWLPFAVGAVCLLILGTGMYWMKQRRRNS